MGRLIQKQHNGALHIKGEETVTPGRALRLFRGVVQFPYTFVAMNGAALVALYAFLRNRKNIWVRTADAEAWETMPQPTGSLSTARPNSMRKAA